MKKKIITLLTLICLIFAFATGCTIVPSDFSGDDGTTAGALDGKVYDLNVEFQTTAGAEYSSLVHMLDDVRPSVYEVYATRENASGVSAGSGTVVAVATPDDDGNPISIIKNSSGSNVEVKTCYIVLTCHHVIDSTDKYLIKDIYGNSFQTFLIGGDPDSDVALIYFSPELDGWQATQNANEYKKGDKTVTIKIAKIRDNTNELKVGESVYAIGNPLGTLGGTVTQGIISATNREITVEGKTMNLIQTDCAINGGNSGGALIDGSGALVGVVNAGYAGDVEGLNFAIPSSVAIDISGKLASTFTGVNYGYVQGKAKINAEFSTSLFQGNDVAIYDYRIDMFSTVVTVYEVSQDYYNQGLRAGDIITSVVVGNNTITPKKAGYDNAGNHYTPAGWLVKDLTSAKVSVGDIVKFNVQRSGVAKEISVQVKQYIYKNTGVFS